MENKNIKHIGSAATEHSQEINEKAQFEVNKNIAMNPNLPMSDRAQGAVGAVGNKISETTHEVKKAYHQNQAGLTSDVVTGQGLKTGESIIKHAGSAAIEHAQEIDQKAQFELNKDIAMNPNLPMGERAQSAVGAVGNKISETTHEMKKAYHQTQAGLTSDIVTGQGLNEYPSNVVSGHKSTTVDSKIKLAGIAATEHAQEIDQKQQF
jgi:predicted HD phosphohydrolase